MNAEEFIVAWIKSEILTPKVLLFKPENFYDELLKTDFNEIEKEEDNNDFSKTNKTNKKNKKRQR